MSNEGDAPTEVGPIDPNNQRIIDAERERNVSAQLRLAAKEALGTSASAENFSAYIFLNSYLDQMQDDEGLNKEEAVEEFADAVNVEVTPFVTIVGDYRSGEISSYEGAKRTLNLNPAISSREIAQAEQVIVEHAVKGNPLLELNAGIESSRSIYTNNGASGTLVASFDGGCGVDETGRPLDPHADGATACFTHDISQNGGADQVVLVENLAMLEPDDPEAVADPVKLG